MSSSQIINSIPSGGFNNDDRAENYSECFHEDEYHYDDHDDEFYGDYDDFILGGSSMKLSNPRQQQQQGKQKQDSNPSVYSSKHVRARDAAIASSKRSSNNGKAAAKRKAKKSTPKNRGK